MNEDDENYYELRQCINLKDKRTDRVHATLLRMLEEVILKEINKARKDSCETTRVE